MYVKYSRKSGRSHGQQNMYHEASPRNSVFSVRVSAGVHCRSPSPERSDSAQDEEQDEGLIALFFELRQQELEDDDQVARNKTAGT